MAECPECQGQGEVRHSRYGAHNCPDPLMTCPTCNGTGQVYAGIARQWRARHTPAKLDGRRWATTTPEERTWPA